MHSDRLQEVMQMENQSCPKMLPTELLILFPALYPLLVQVCNVNPELLFSLRQDRSLPQQLLNYP